MKLSLSEENYIKHIFHLSVSGNRVHTNAIAESLKAKASSVTDMMNKLSQKKIIQYEKYKGVALTPGGKKSALGIIRKHRLWEVFLVTKLGFGWDKVHEIAEELEHITSTELIDKLDDFLENPKFDPHGDPIPDRNGQFMTLPDSIPLAQAKLNSVYMISHVTEDDSTFLSFLSQLGLVLNTRILIKKRFAYNNSAEIEIPGQNKMLLLDESTQKKIMIHKKGK